MDDAPINPDDLLTVNEVAKRLKLTPIAVRHLVYRGRLAAYKLAGRRMRIRRQDLDDFLVRELQPVVPLGVSLVIQR